MHKQTMKVARALLDLGSGLPRNTQKVLRELGGCGACYRHELVNGTPTDSGLANAMGLTAHQRTTHGVYVTLTPRGAAVAILLMEQVRVMVTYLPVVPGHDDGFVIEEFLADDEHAPHWCMNRDKVDVLRRRLALKWVLASPTTETAVLTYRQHVLNCAEAGTGELYPEVTLLREVAAELGWTMAELVEQPRLRDTVANVVLTWPGTMEQALDRIRAEEGVDQALDASMYR